MRFVIVMSFSERRMVGGAGEPVMVVVGDSVWKEKFVRVGM